MSIVLDADEATVESNDVTESNRDRLGFDKTIFFYLYRPDASVLVKTDNEVDSDATNHIAPQKRKLGFSGIRASVLVPSSHTQEGEHAADDRGRQKKNKDKCKGRYRDRKNAINTS
jgi:hypothetical protein